MPGCIDVETWFDGSACCCSCSVDDFATSKASYSPIYSIDIRSVCLSVSPHADINWVLCFESVSLNLLYGEIIHQVKLTDVL